MQRLILRLCRSDYLDALLGDLEELRARRARVHGRWYARLRYGLDVASALVFQSRARYWTARQWGLAGALTIMTVVGLGGRVGRSEPYTITAIDAAGVFTLDLFHGHVTSATVAGQVLPPERIVQRGRHLTLRGAALPTDLEIEITRRGGIRWEAREPAYAATPQGSPIEIDWARQYFAEVDSVSRADGGKLWGVPLAGPMFFVARASRAVVANVSDSAGLLSEQDGVWVGTLPQDVGIANTAVEWAGRRWTMVMWPVSSQGYSRRQLLLHESFHRIQPLLGLEMASPVNAHLASRDGRIYTRLEWRALAEALIRTGDARRRAIEDALAFRTRRYALFPGAAAEEYALERNEGLAEYTGLRLSGLPEAARAITAARALMAREASANFTRSFAYASGPAYGVLLDAADPSWRDRVRGKEGLDELLRLASGLPRQDGKDAAARAERYDGSRVIAEETRAAERAAAEQARLRAAFVEGPTLRLPKSKSLAYSFDPNGAVPLEGQGTVYGTAEVRDEWGRLIVQSGGVLLRREGESVIEAVVPVARGTDAPPTSGEGWRLELAEGWVVRPGSRAGDWVVAQAQ